LRLPFDCFVRSSIGSGFVGGRLSCGFGGALHEAAVLARTQQRLHVLALGIVQRCVASLVLQVGPRAGRQQRLDAPAPELDGLSILRADFQ